MGRKRWHSRYSYGGGDYDDDMSAFLESLLIQLREPATPSYIGTGYGYSSKENCLHDWTTLLQTKRTPALDWREVKELPVIAADISGSSREKCIDFDLRRGTLPASGLGNNPVPAAIERAAYVTQRPMHAASRKRDMGYIFVHSSRSYSTPYLTIQFPAPMRGIPKQLMIDLVLAGGSPAATTYSLEVFSAPKNPHFNYSVNGWFTNAIESSGSTKKSNQALVGAYEVVGIDAEGCPGHSLGKTFDHLHKTDLSDIEPDNCQFHLKEGGTANGIKSMWTLKLTQNAGNRHCSVARILILDSKLSLLHENSLRTKMGEAGPEPDNSQISLSEYIDRIASQDDLVPIASELLLVLNGPVLVPLPAVLRQPAPDLVIGEGNGKFPKAKAKVTTATPVPAAAASPSEVPSIVKRPLPSSFSVFSSLAAAVGHTAKKPRPAPVPVSPVVPPAAAAGSSVATSSRLTESFIRTVTNVKAVKLAPGIPILNFKTTGTTFTATAMGTYPYTVSGNLTTLRNTCTCPQGLKSSGRCKHVAALLMHARNQGLG